MAKRPSFEPESTRTIAFVGHRAAGKTTLVEHVLVTGRVVRKPGQIERGNTLLDAQPMEKRHRSTLRNGYAWLVWREHLIHMVDTPGFRGGVGDREGALGAVDAVVVVIDATAKIELEAKEALEEAGRRGLPRLVVVSKCDRPHNWYQVLKRLNKLLDNEAIPLHQPFYGPNGSDVLAGLVSVPAGRVIRYAEDGSGNYSPEPIPVRYREEHELAWEALSEAVAATDDDLLESYLEYLELPREMVWEGLRNAVGKVGLTPVLLASGARGIGGASLLDAVVDWLPSANERDCSMLEDEEGEPVAPSTSEFVATLVGRHRDEHGNPWTMLRVLSGRAPHHGRWVQGASGDSVRVRKLYRIRGPRRAIAQNPAAGELVATWDPIPGRIGDIYTSGPRWKRNLPSMPITQVTWLLQPRQHTFGSAATLGDAVQGLLREDPALSHSRVGGDVLLGGLSEAHLQLALERLTLRTGLAIRKSLPPVAYRETPLSAAVGIEGIHRLEDSQGMVQEFGVCRVDLRPQDVRNGTSFLDCVDDAVEDLPSEYRPAVHEGTTRGMAHGPMAGYPLLGVDLRLMGGEYSMISSSEEHFRRAGELAVRRALEVSGTQLLEPWSEVEVRLPSGAVGVILSDLSSHRGRILNLDTRVLETVIFALCPDRELRTFAVRLQTLTSGRGVYSRQPSHYEKLPDHLVSEAVASSPFRLGTSALTDSGRRAC
ncbi:MAG: hypothetical protein GWP91_19840 [Rhodobacterales bacterium]|nr:hypothetical protein [Rhodobacterales bacterium]